MTSRLRGFFVPLCGKGRTDLEDEQMSLVADTAMLAGTLILENGGETYRAEETALRVCEAGGIVSPEILALPTGILLSGNQGMRTEQHGLMRIHQSAVHLYKLERTNSYCRAYTRGELTVEELSERLLTLRASNQTIPLPLNAVLSGLTTAAFAIMLNGGLHDAWMAMICGILLALATAPLAKSTISTVTVNMTGGAVVAAAAALLTSLVGKGNLDIILVSSTMPLLPGLATLNAVRDAMCGDLVSGNARLLRAMLSALSIAAGVGITLAIYVSVGGLL